MSAKETYTAKTIKMTINSRLEEVSLVGSAVHGICANLSLSGTEASQMEACVVEVVNNAIKHSYHLQPGHEVDITISLYPDRIEFSICNTGEPMKSWEKTSIDFDPQDVCALPEGGMGLYIIKSIMDEVTYEYLDGVNNFSMSKHLNKVL